MPVKMSQEAYGLQFDKPVSQLETELYCFREALSPDEGGLGKCEHLKNAIKLIWPKLEWHPWMELQLESLCENRWVSWTGCAASGKTFTSSLYAMAWWLADPMKSSVILTSTTAKMIRKRSWACVQHLWRQSSAEFPGNMVDSKTTLQSVKGDDKNAIFAIAVLDGSTSKAVANIQGIHSERILAIVDEATDTPPAVFEAASNLSKGCKEFQFLAIANPHSHLDEHGRFSEPAGGWESVSSETQQWKTKRGICVRFDGLRSPNVIAGQTKWDFLITQEQLDSSMKYDGADSPRFHKYTRGFWPPEGISRTVLSEALCQKHQVSGLHRFNKKTITIGGLDPAFGGDRCVLRFAKYGELESGLMGVEFTSTIQIQINSQSEEPIHYQIARQVKSHCLTYDCAPKNLAVDATGEGGGLCDIMAREWSPHINRVEFGGRGSDMPVSDGDSRPAHEAYANKVTELWFSVREWVVRDQIRGMDAETQLEFCQRIFDDEKRKVSIERKAHMKNRTGRSPDLGDAAALIVHQARWLGPGHLNSGTIVDIEWEEFAKEKDSIYSEEGMYADSEG